MLLHNKQKKPWIDILALRLISVYLHDIKVGVIGTPSTHDFFVINHFITHRTHLTTTDDRFKSYVPFLDRS